MKTIIFNPFLKIAGVRALIIGFLGILIASVIAFYSNVSFDGVLDIHLGTELPYLTHLGFGILNWLVMVLVFGLLSLLMARGRFRWIDVLGTMAFARIPFLLAPLSGIFLDIDSLSDKLDLWLSNKELPEFNSMEIAGVAFAGLLVLFLTIWFITWAWHAFTHSANLKGSKAVVAFIGGLLAAEIISKLVLALIL